MKTEKLYRAFIINKETQEVMAYVEHNNRDVFLNEIIEAVPYNSDKYLVRPEQRREENV